MPRGDTQYFLEVERLVLDQHLKATLERAAGLRSRAIKQHDMAAMDEVTAMERMVLLLRRRLRTLAPHVSRRSQVARDSGAPLDA
jgi:hypothetical protein